MTTENTSPDSAEAPGLTEDEIRTGYRLFLDRAPSETELARMQAAHGTFQSLRQTFMKSAEFAHHYAPYGQARNAEQTQQVAIPRQATLHSQEPNMQPSDAQRVVFLHVPKCGGTTLHHILGEWFGPHNVHPERFNELYSYTGAQLATSLVFSGHYDYYATTLIPGPKQLISFLRDPAERLVSLYNFHRAHTAEMIAENNLLLPRWANQYDIDDYFSRPEIRAHPAINNMIVRVFSGIPQTTPSLISAPLRTGTLDDMLEQALESLERFAFVGFMDTYDADVVRLGAVLQRDPPADVGRHQVLDDMMEAGIGMRKIEKQRPSAQCRDSIEELIQYDRKFYARAQELFG